MRTLRLSLFLSLGCVSLLACGDDDGVPTTDAGNVDGGPDCGALTDCDGLCVDSDTDPRHCGGCGMACASGEVCAAGACVLTCPGALVDCEGSCVDLRFTPEHCGACGTACAEGEVCADGVCGVPACPGDLVDCDGTCTDLDHTPTHCGACGTACAADEVCGDGVCMLRCPSGQDECAGGCFDLTSSAAHCGDCDVACAAGEACVDGTCGVSCPAGQDVCGDGCHDLQNDPLHCGACDNACAGGELCVSGTCAPSCGAGLLECDSMCVDPSSNPLFCGATDCADGDVGEVCEDDEACIDGSCAPACAEGFTVCGGECVDLQTDTENCGTCGNACALCVAGACLAGDCNGDEITASPDGTMKVCDDPTNVTCEQDFADLCPTGWDLCTPSQYENRRAGWGFTLSERALGELYCRGASGAGHWTFPDAGSADFMLGNPGSFNCYFGTSRDSCTATYGCNERSAHALCCAPTSTCGDGVVDAPEEDCDDMNDDETDECLNTCTWRVPRDHGLSGTNC